MKHAKVICWVRSKNDTRDTASSTAVAVVPQKDAMRLARDIDTFGNAGDYLHLFALPVGSRLASGHGVTVIYESGARRYTKR